MTHAWAWGNVNENMGRHGPNTRGAAMHSVYRNIPTSYEEARALTQGRADRTIGYATRVVRSSYNGDIYLYHHHTAIVCYHSGGSVSINTGGWRSSTTKARINAALRGSGWALVSERGQWWWHRWSKEPGQSRMFEFEDGDRVYLDPDDVPITGPSWDHQFEPFAVYA